jgi:hypothetical protein
MLYKTLIDAVFLLLSLAMVPVLSNQQNHDDQLLRAKVQILQQKYCREDKDLFTVSLKLRVEVLNPFTLPVLMRTPLVPYIAKVSSNIIDAESGRILYEIAQSHYPQNARPSKTARIAAGKTITLQTGYDFVARYRSAFSYPQSLSAGTFAVILVLKPELESSEEKARADVVNSLVTEPFIVQINENPKVVSCD